MRSGLEAIRHSVRVAQTHAKVCTRQLQTIQPCCTAAASPPPLALIALFTCESCSFWCLNCLKRDLLEMCTSYTARPQTERQLGPCFDTGRSAFQTFSSSPRQLLQHASMLLRLLQFPTPRKQGRMPCRTHIIPRSCPQGYRANPWQLQELGTGTGLTSQISSAYCLMVRSELKKPEPAV